MNIDKLIARQEELIAETDAALKARGIDKAMIARPIEIQQARVEALRTRIADVQQAKADYVASVEAEIEALNAEMATLGQKIDSDLKALGPALDAVAEA